MILVYPNYKKLPAQLLGKNCVTLLLHLLLILNELMSVWLPC